MPAMQGSMRFVSPRCPVARAGVRTGRAWLRRALYLAVLLPMMDAPPTAAQTVASYSNDFSAGSGGGSVVGGISAVWSTSATDVTPSGRHGRFLGQFDNTTVTLRLTNLPAHRRVVVGFKLFVIQSWDGNGRPWGPDLWEYGVVGGPRFLRTTFRNPTAVEEAAGQSYPGPYPSGYPSQTGALEVNTLGYWFGNEVTPLRPTDSVYQLGQAFNHSGSSLELYFAGLNLQGIGDESWGLDEISVALLRQ
jgi:hypothetical protein